jgi:hypothetical protein
MKWQIIVWNEMELFGVKLNYLELKLMKRNVLGVSPSIDRTLDKTCYNSIYNSIYHSIYNTI